MAPQAKKRKTDGGRRSINPRKTLASLLKYMEDYEVIVELKTGKRHRGRLMSADDNMDLILEEECGENEDSSQRSFLSRSIRGSNVRYVHFPDNADLTTIVRSGRDREKEAAKKYQKTRRKSDTT